MTYFADSKKQLENGGIILDERNVLDNYYQVQAWEAAHPDYAYKITHDVANGLQDLHFEFKNMYL